MRDHEHNPQQPQLARRIEHGDPLAPAVAPPAFRCPCCTSVRDLLARRDHESDVLRGERCDVCAGGFAAGHFETVIATDASREIDQ